MQEEKGRSSRKNGFVYDSGEATAVGKVTGPSGPPATGEASKTPATSTAITAMFDIF